MNFEFTHFRLIKFNLFVINKVKKEYKYVMKKTIYALFLLSMFLFAGILPTLNMQSYAHAESDSVVSTIDLVSQKNAFRILRKVDEDGKIEISYIFPVGSENLQKLAFTDAEIKTYRFYLVTYVNALAQNYKQKAKEGVEVSACTYFLDVDGLGFSITFESVDLQKEFFKSDDDENDDNQDETEETSNTKTSGFFMKKTEIFSTFAFSSKEVAESYCNLCKMATESWCENSSISNEKRGQILEGLEEAVFIYDFASTSTRLKSNLSYNSENLHHNVFIKTLAEIEQDNQIVFWTVVPNVPVWYLSALVVVIVCMVLAYLIKRKKNNK